MKHPEIKREAVAIEPRAAPRYQTKLNEKSFYRFDISLFHLRLVHLEIHSFPTEGYRHLS